MCVCVCVCQVYAVLVVLGLLQVTIIFIILTTCLWQCYSNHTLRAHFRDLTKANSTPPPPTKYPDVESLGAIPRANGSSLSSKTKSNSASSAVGDASTAKVVTASGIQRSSSASCLSELSKSTRIQAKLSQSDYLSAGGGSGRGLLLQEGEREVEWLGSNSMFNLEDYAVNVM